jgi:hypothetical protein
MNGYERRLASRRDALRARQKSVVSFKVGVFGLILTALFSVIVSAGLLALFIFVAVEVLRALGVVH